MKLLDTPLFKTENNAIHSAKYDCLIDWNNFEKTFRHVSREKYSFLLVKTLLKEHYI